MKQLVLTLSFVAFLVACNTKDEKTRIREAEERYEEELLEKRIQQKEHTEEMQHLVDVACGLTDAGVRERYKALEKLREEYPSMEDRWKELEEDILN